MHRIYPPPPPPRNYISHRYGTEVDFQSNEMGPLAYYMADDFFIPNPPLNTTHTQHSTVSTSTIRRRLRAADVTSRRPYRGPILTHRSGQLRL